MEILIEVAEKYLTNGEKEMYLTNGEKEICLAYTNALCTVAASYLRGNVNEVDPDDVYVKTTDAYIDLGDGVLRNARGGDCDAASVSICLGGISDGEPSKDSKSQEPGERDGGLVSANEERTPASAMIDWPERRGGEDLSERLNKQPFFENSMHDEFTKVIDVWTMASPGCLDDGESLVCMKSE
jgi:hypothetical protein